MRKLPISLTLYTTTKGHFGCKTNYQHTVKSLSNQISIKEFGSATAHIKISEGEMEGGLEMSEFLSKAGLNILSTEKNWNREGNNHAEGYFQDMMVMMNSESVHKNEFILFLEDDWIINTDKLDFWLSEGVKCLKKNKDILCVRINDEINKDVSRATSINKYIYTQDSDYTIYGPTLTFQPTLMRTRDWYAAVRHINKDWEKVKNQHCELISGYYMHSLFSNSPTPFAFFDPEKINATHIGTEKFAKENL